MSAVIRQWCLLIVVASGVLVGCSSERDRQWYKPNVNYSVGDFKRDRDSCTGKDNILDEQCMKDRGWVPLTSDRAAPPKPSSTNPRGPKY
jgi:hypothetical protein